MPDIEEGIKSKLEILKSYDFFKTFLESDHPAVQNFAENLETFNQEIGFTQAELERIKELSVPISKIPKKFRYDKLLIGLLSEGFSFDAGNRIFHIEPLSDSTLKEASKLLMKVFSHGLSLEHPKVALRASLAMQKKGIKGFAYKLLSRTFARVSEVKYWVVIDDATQRVVGISGLYCYRKDENEADWGGWTCVGPDYRAYGIAFRLYNFIIAKAKSRGKKYLRVYSSTDPREAIANKIFPRKGFRLIKREPMKGTSLEWLYWEKEL